MGCFFLRWALIAILELYFFVQALTGHVLSFLKFFFCWLTCGQMDWETLSYCYSCFSVFISFGRSWMMSLEVGSSFLITLKSLQVGLSWEKFTKWIHFYFGRDRLEIQRACVLIWGSSSCWVHLASCFCRWKVLCLW